jgi:Galactose oxidase, central domain
MNAARYYHTMTLLQTGVVIVVGGDGASSNRLASAEIYDPVANTWVLTGSLTFARFFHTATLLPNNTLLVAGGNAVPDGSSCELYW